MSENGEQTGSGDEATPSPPPPPPETDRDATLETRTWEEKKQARDKPSRERDKSD